MSDDCKKENNQIRNNPINFKNLDPKYLLKEYEGQENEYICRICNLIVNDPVECTYCE